MDAEDERTEIDPRDNPWAMLAALPLFSGLPKQVVDEAVAELEWTSLPGGALLFEAGGPADAVYFVVSGCLGVYGPGGELVGRIAAGDRSARWGSSFRGRAGRPCAHWIRNSRSFWRAPSSACSSATRWRYCDSPASPSRIDDRNAERQRVMTPRTLALIPLDEAADLPLHAARLVDALARFGRVYHVGRERAGGHSPQWFHERESKNDFVVYSAEAGDTPWTRLCLRQADVVLVAAAAPRRRARLGRTPLARRRHAPGRAVAAA